MKRQGLEKVLQGRSTEIAAAHTEISVHQAAAKYTRHQDVWHVTHPVGERALCLAPSDNLENLESYIYIPPADANLAPLCRSF